MSRDFIGVIRGANSGTILAVVNPDDDGELDNPRLLLLKSGPTEAVEMVKIPRGEYTGALTPEQLVSLLAKFKT